MLFVGDDWAEEYHDVELQERRDDLGRVAEALQRESLPRVRLEGVDELSPTPHALAERELGHEWYCSQAASCAARSASS